MAEVFGVASGALQVAEAGIKLAKTLYEYLDAVRNANKQLEAVALQVKVTSSTLRSLGELLEDHEAEKVCSKHVVEDAQLAFKGCERTFLDVEDTFRALIRSDGPQSGKVTTSGRWVFPFKKGKLETLQSNLERLKTTLLLMLSVLTYARESKNRTVDNKSKLDDQKRHIQTLMKERQEATKRHEELLAAFSRLETNDQQPPPPQYNPQPDKTSNTRDLGGMGVNIHSFMAISSNVPPVTHSQSNPTTEPKEIDNQKILEHLSNCAEAVSRLSQEINKAASMFSFNKTTTLTPIDQSFRDATEKIHLMLHQTNHPGYPQRQKVMPATPHAYVDYQQQLRLLEQHNRDRAAITQPQMPKPIIAIPQPPMQMAGPPRPILQMAANPIISPPPAVELSDWQKQLLMLEAQNKQRVLMARQQMQQSQPQQGPQQQIAMQQVHQQQAAMRQPQQDHIAMLQAQQQRQIAMQQSRQQQATLNMAKVQPPPPPAPMDQGMSLEFTSVADDGLSQFDLESLLKTAIDTNFGFSFVNKDKEYDDDDEDEEEDEEEYATPTEDTPMNPEGDAVSPAYNLVSTEQQPDIVHSPSGIPLSPTTQAYIKAHKLDDYQIELMLLERKNEKRLLRARQDHEGNEWMDVTNPPHQTFPGQPATYHQSDMAPVFDAPRTALHPQSFEPLDGQKLSDYHMQLMLLEQQNKKRLLMARQEPDEATVVGGSNLPTQPSPAFAQLNRPLAPTGAPAADSLTPPADGRARRRAKSDMYTTAPAASASRGGRGSRLRRTARLSSSASSPSDPNRPQFYPRAASSRAKERSPSPESPTGDEMLLAYFRNRSNKETPSSSMRGAESANETTNEESTQEEQAKVLVSSLKKKSKGQKTSIRPGTTLAGMPSLREAMANLPPFVPITEDQVKQEQEQKHPPMPFSIEEPEEPARNARMLLSASSPLSMPSRGNNQQGLSSDLVVNLCSSGREDDASKRTQTEASESTCEFCDKKFTRAYVLRSHVRRVHAGDEVDPEKRAARRSAFMDVDSEVVDEDFEAVGGAAPGDDEAVQDTKKKQKRASDATETADGPVVSAEVDDANDVDDLLRLWTTVDVAS